MIPVRVSHEAEWRVTASWMAGPCKHPVERKEQVRVGPNRQERNQTKGFSPRVYILSTYTPAPPTRAICLRNDSGRAQAPVDELGTDPEVPTDDLR